MTRLTLVALLAWCYVCGAVPDTHTISDAGGNFMSGGTWVSGVTPGNGDSVVATSTSGNLNVPAGSGFPYLAAIDLTGYTGTFTIASDQNVFVRVASGTSVCKFAGTMGEPGGVPSGNLELDVASGATLNLTMGGFNKFPHIYIGLASGYTGTVQLQDGLTALVNLNATRGTFYSNGHAINCAIQEATTMTLLDITGSTWTVNATSEATSITSAFLAAPSAFVATNSIGYFYCTGGNIHSYSAGGTHFQP